MKYRSRYKQLSIVAIAVMALILAGVFIRFRMQNSRGGQTGQTASSGAAMTINGFKHTATRNGQTEWILHAATAEIYSVRNLAVLTDIDMTVFASDRTEVNLTADTGEFDTKTRDMHVQGSIVARYPGYELRTESLHYRHDSHILYTEQQVVITGRNLRICADSAEFDLRADQVMLKGHVQTWMDPSEQP